MLNSNIVVVTKRKNVKIRGKGGSGLDLLKSVLF